MGQFIHNSKNDKSFDHGSLVLPKRCTILSQIKNRIKKKKKKEGEEEETKDNTMKKRTHSHGCFKLRHVVEENKL